MLNWKPVEFFQTGCNMTHFVKSEDGAAKSILDSLLFSYVGLAYPIKYRVTETIALARSIAVSSLRNLRR